MRKTISNKRFNVIFHMVRHAALTSSLPVIAMGAPYRFPVLVRNCQHCASTIPELRSKTGKKYCELNVLAISLARVILSGLMNISVA